MIIYGGCLLPLLLVLNTIFGWMFLNFKYWLLLELLLLSAVWLGAFTFDGKISGAATGRRRRRNDVIDVEAKIIDSPANPREEEGRTKKH